MAESDSSRDPSDIEAMNSEQLFQALCFWQARDEYLQRSGMKAMNAQQF
jgi:hypothetical protein